MAQRSSVDYQFQKKSKFALLTVNDVHTDLPSVAFQLSDGTWVMPGVPVPNLGIWKEWIGSIRAERLSRANLVLFVEEPSQNPEIVDEVHERLDKALSDLFYMLHLRTGIEVAEGADLLCGSSINGVPGIRQMSHMPTFHQSKGWQRAPITTAWLEESLVLRAGVAAMDTDKTQFRRVVRGLVTLFKGLQETAQDRLHQKVTEMLQSDRIRTLPAEVKKNSVLLALDAAGVKIEEVRPARLVKHRITVRRRHRTAMGGPRSRRYTRSEGHAAWWLAATGGTDGRPPFESDVRPSVHSLGWIEVLDVAQSTPVAILAVLGLPRAI